jgi:hypothetical protein
MKILTKKLGPAEVKCRCLVLPRDKKGNFPSPGVEFDISEGKMIHRARLDNQFRLRVATWFRQHRAVKAGDEITLSRDNGTIHISLSRSLSKPENETFDWAHEVIDAIKNGEIDGILRINGKGFSVEIGEHVKETHIIFATKKSA